jgi:isopenicillin N synthase-like dioxygenase
MKNMQARRVPAQALPVIDISGLNDADMSVRRGIGEHMRAACGDLGFMYVIGHGVDEALRTAVFKQAAEFFAWPEDEKLALKMELSPCNRGYEALGGQTLEDGAPPDLKEGFYVGEELSLDHPRVRACQFNLGPNQWPDNMPKFREVMNTYYTVMLELGESQVMGNDGEWIHAPPLPGSYVVNLGDMIARWTNDRYRSTLHRVINLSGQERYSVPFFFSGNPAHEVSALPGCLGEGETPKYPPTTVEAHMREMYARTYA